MNIEILRLTAANAGILLDRVAAEVFDEPVDRPRLDAYLAASGHHMIVAIRDGVVVGQVAAVVHFHPDKPAELYIDEVGVTPALQRRGIARKMLDEMLALGRMLGCADAWLGTEPDNEPARRLYGSYGVEADPAMIYLFEL